MLGTFTYGYVGATGRLASVTYPNGQTSSYAYYDNVGDLRLQTIHHQRPGGATLSRFDYTYDVVGNILTWQQQADSAAPTVWRYGYDAADQLTSAVHQTTERDAGAHDAVRLHVRPGGEPDRRADRRRGDADDARPLNRLVTQAAGRRAAVQGTVSEPGTVTVQGQPARWTRPNRVRGRRAGDRAGRTR